jgi:hypothetical protein
MTGHNDTTEKEAHLTSAGFFLMYFLGVGLLGAHCVDYCIWAISGQDISYGGDLVIAVFFAGAAIPLSLLLWVAGLLGLMYPLVS